MVLLKRASLIIAASAMLFSCAIGVAARVVERTVAFLFSAFAPEPMRLAIDGPAVPRTIYRPPLASSLLESLRHEKGVPRFGAARNI